MATHLGISGRIANQFLRSQLTLLLVLVGLLMGFFAVLVTPREEEPQIDVTFANVYIAFPGATVAEVENLVSIPGEQVLSEIEGIEHVYSMSKPGLSVLTVQFQVGEARNQAIVRLYNAIFSNQDWLPPTLGVAQPIIKPKGIDDVPIVTLTLWTNHDALSAYELRKVAHAMEAELKRIPGTRDIYTIGGPDDVVHVLLDPQRMAGYNIAIDDLRQALHVANVSQDAGAIVANNQEIAITAGTFLSRADDIASLIVGMSDDGAIYLSDVATVTRRADQPQRYVWFGTGAAASDKGIEARGEFPAVTLAVAKKPGTNAVDIAANVINRFDQLRGIIVPDGVQVTVTRNYGKTADDKAMTLITKLIFATASVVVLVLLTMGPREAFIVGTAVVVTLMVTLFASWAWGFTLNRVSLFALIFSIGILVDDAIVVVENIHRHRQTEGVNLVEAIPIAVNEVGGPTILATITVIAALLPMAFISGLMGPYMSPIPINASMGMFISLAVAFIITPWLSLKLFGKTDGSTRHSTSANRPAVLYRLFNAVLSPFLHEKKGRILRWLMLLVVITLIAASLSLAGMKWVVLKMLPFDNKSELQVVVDMPEGAALEQTAAVMGKLGRYIATVPEVTDYQVYVGTASPINFNGLLRQYYMRSEANQGDIQVNLVDKSQRERKSHDIALALREPLQAIGRPYDATVTLVEVPPGPPVYAPLVAEIYGIDYPEQITVAKKIRSLFASIPEIVDVDDSSETPTPRVVISVDRARAARLGLTQATVVNAINSAMGGEDVGYLRDSGQKYAIPVRIELPVKSKADQNAFLDLKVRNTDGMLISIRAVVTLTETLREQTVYHKDLLPVVFVTGNVAGETDSPLYGMFKVSEALYNTPVYGDEIIDQYFFSVPDKRYRFALKWDGEWQVTYETFRDMGIAYGVGMILIYLLVVAQFRSYLTPLIIMAPIPLTVIGVMPGHALLGAPFTATSMIGMIALAGIIVRNSILLVDFINEELVRGTAFAEAVIRAAAVRAKPIILTAVAAMLGALFILDDSIFNGLAITFLFGIFISTVLTLVVIPVMYYAFQHKGC